LAGKLWFVGGIVITLVTLVVPNEIGHILFMVGVGILGLIPMIYSYAYFKKHPHA